MAAFGVGAAALMGAALALVLLRFSAGGWKLLLQVRRGERRDPAGRSWADLTLIERTWFVGAPISLLVAAVFFVLGLVVELRT